MITHLPGSACRVLYKPGKRNREVDGMRHRDVVSVIGIGRRVGCDRGAVLSCREAVSVGGFDNDASCGHFGEAFVEGWWRERGRTRDAENGRGFTAPASSAAMRWSTETCSTERPVGQRPGRAAGRPGERESEAGGGAMLDGQDDAVVTAAAEVAVGVTAGRARPRGWHPHPFWRGGRWPRRRHGAAAGFAEHRAGVGIDETEIPGGGVRILAAVRR
jgi:hypothetical protein